MEVKINKQQYTIDSIESLTLRLNIRGGYFDKESLLSFLDTIQIELAKHEEQTKKHTIDTF